MKIENRFVKIEIYVEWKDNKKRIESKAEIKHNRKALLKGKAVLSSLLVIILTGSLLAYVQTTSSSMPAIASTESRTESAYPDITVTEDSDLIVGADYTTSSYLASLVQDKYANEENAPYTYGEAIRGLKRNEPIKLELGFDPIELGFEDWRNIAEIYIDSDLTQSLGAHYETDEEETYVSLIPSPYPDGIISTSFLTTEQVHEFPHSNTSFFDKNATEDWGNIATMYLVIRVNLQTGESLDKPEVRIINRVGEIAQTPSLHYQISDDGVPVYSWNEVADAEKYFLVYMSENSDGVYDGGCFVVAETADTTWTDTDIEYGIGSIVNSDYRTYRISENDWNNEYQVDYYQEKYGQTSGIVKDDTNLKKFAVIAVSKDGTSMLSNGFTQEEMAPNLPYMMALDTAKKAGSFQYSYDSFEQIPIYGYVTMCDGTTVKKLITYDVDKAQVIADRYANIDEEGNPISFETIDVLQIPYHIDGTPFEDILKVVDYDRTNQTSDLKGLKERQDKLRTKAGAVEVIETQTEDVDMYGAHFEQNVREIDSAMKVYGNSALSEYLALNMLGTTRIIDLSLFPESADSKYLSDAWKEAYYQNPYILGADGYGISYDGTKMEVFYNDKMKTTEKKQKRLRAKISEVISNIIEKDMTDIDKEMAINQYLCDTITYDEDALNNAEENDYKSVDAEFNDSFTAYGAMMNGRCVCAGYAAAFKLLAEEAGLDAIVVTGILDGGLSHAWNKVCIDGKWQIIDTTNNDNEFLSNVLLNLPDQVGKRALVPDKDAILDKCIKKYEATDDQKEYYRIENKYFPEDDIAEQLAEGLMEDRHVTLRTEYDLDDTRFFNITDKVYDIIGDAYKLQGYYWMGVIYLSCE